MKVTGVKHVHMAENAENEENSADSDDTATDSTVPLSQSAERTRMLK